MTVQDVGRSVRKRWKYVLIPVLLVTLVVGVWSKLSDPAYTARSSVYVSLPFGQSASDLSQGAIFTQQQIASYAELATRPIVLGKVISSLNLDATTTSLARQVTARPLPDSVIIDIEASAGTPELSADISNAVAKELTAVVEGLSPKGQDKNPSVVVTQIAQAQPPQYPSSPRTSRNILAAGLGAFLFGVALAIARQTLDTRVRQDSDLPAQVPVLGTIEIGHADRPLAQRGLTPARKLGERERAAENLARAEAFRRLRTKLRFIDVDHPVQVITVTSSVSGEGKTSTSIDLARWVAADGMRVLLIDADLRRPRVAEYLSLEGAIGLTDVLAGDVPLDLAIQRWSADNLAVLPSGSTPPNPAELLGSEAMTTLLATLSERYELIIMDTPPLVPVIDGAVAGVAADGVVLVIHHGRTTKHQVSVALDTLRSVDARLLGVVFNRVPTPGAWSRASTYSVYETAGSEGP